MAVSIEGQPIGSRSLPAGVDVGWMLSIDRSNVAYPVRSVDADAEPPVVELGGPEFSPGTGVVDGGVALATTEFISSTGGGRIAIHDFGGTGPDLLVCHATGFHGMAYAPFAAALSAHHRVWAMDFRGHGAADDPAAGDFGWTGMAEDVLSVVDHLGVGPMLGVGHSMGGASILTAELLRPGTFRAVYLYEPVVLPFVEPADGSGSAFMADVARSRRAEFDSRQAVFERYGSRPPLGTLRADALASYVEHGFVDHGDGVRLACTPEAEAATFAAPDKRTVTDVAGVDLPVCVGIGGVDADGGPAMMAEPLIAAVGGAARDAHEELGHFGPLQDPDRTARSALKFFAKFTQGQANTPG